MNWIKELSLPCSFIQSADIDRLLIESKRYIFHEKIKQISDAINVRDLTLADKIRVELRSNLKKEYDLQKAVAVQLCIIVGAKLAQIKDLDIDNGFFWIKNQKYSFGQYNGKIINGSVSECSHVKI